jgi:hypothetical protein
MDDDQVERPIQLSISESAQAMAHDLSGGGGDGGYPRQPRESGLAAAAPRVRPGTE